MATLELRVPQDRRVPLDLLAQRVVLDKMELEDNKDVLELLGSLELQAD